MRLHSNLNFSINGSAGLFCQSLKRDFVNGRQRERNLPGFLVSVPFAAHGGTPTGTAERRLTRGKQVMSILQSHGKKRVFDRRWGGRSKLKKETAHVLVVEEASRRVAVPGWNGPAVPVPRRRCGR